MDHSFSPVQTNSESAATGFGSMRLHLAESLVGQTVELFVDATTIAHGIVAGVLTEMGIPKLVVGGTCYDLNQILTATPASLA
jgi:hypothetical protein